MTTAMTTPTIPFSPRRSIDIGSLQELAAQRNLPPSLEQRRDSQGQYISHKDIPDTKRQDR